MNEEILKELNIVVCRCGLLIQLDNAKDYQYDWDKRTQKVICPICKKVLWDDRE